MFIIVCLINEHFWTFFWHLMDTHVERIDCERCSDDDQQISVAKVLVCIKELFRKVLTEKGDLRLNWSITSFLLGAVNDFASCNSFIQLSSIIFLATFCTNSSKVASMCLYNLILGKTSFYFQIIYILGQIILYYSLILEHFAKMMHISCLGLLHLQKFIC